MADLQNGASLSNAEHPFLEEEGSYLYTRSTVNIFLEPTEDGDF